MKRCPARSVFVLDGSPYNVKKAKYGPLRRSMSFKVNDFGTSGRPVCDFLLVNHSNLPPILYRFRDIAIIS